MSENADTPPLNTPAISPEQLTGTPDQWYDNATPLTALEATEQSMHDWFIRPLHGGYYINRPTSNTMPIARTKLSEAIRRKINNLLSFQAAVENKTLDIENIDDDLKPYMHMSADEITAVITEQMHNEPSPSRLLITTHIQSPSWIDAELLMADDERGERVLWGRRKDGRWRKLVSARGDYSGITDAVMAERNPKRVDIVEED